MTPRTAKHGLHYKLIRVFLLQVLLISLATLIAVFAAAKVVEDVLLKQALEGEASYFWALYRQYKNVPRPNTMNMQGYLAVDSDYSEVPPELRSLKPGYTRTRLQGRTPIVYVQNLNQSRLYLVFDEEQVAGLSFYFGVVPLTLVLISIYLVAWLSYRQTRKAISPLVKLARRVDQFNIREQSLAELDLNDLRHETDSEILILIDALDHFTERMELFIERERNFSRDASHELRTPLTVIKSSLALLQKRADYQENEKKALVLIDRTLCDMETLIDALLLLAREESAPLPEDDILINDLISNLVEQLTHIMAKPQLDLKMEVNCLLTITAPEKVLSIVFANLLRNAFTYTEKGIILIRIEQHSVSISDSGVGIDKEQLRQVFEPFYRGSHDKKGHGLGLAIVKRLCNRYGWSSKVHSKPGEGTCVSVNFPNAQVLNSRP